MVWEVGRWLRVACVVGWVTVGVVWVVSGFGGWVRWMFALAAVVIILALPSDWEVHRRPIRDSGDSPR